ncbi:MAG: hypothetical protein ACM3NR_02600 [Methanosarcina sp.]
MNGNRMMQQVTAIFSVFMVIFYIGVGIYFIWFFKGGMIDKPVRVILGAAFLFYGIYRGLRSFEKIKEAYFSKDDEEDRDNYSRNGHYNRYK